MWAPDYLTLAALKTYLHIFDTADDADLAVAITAASRAVDNHCNRQFGLLAAAEKWSYVARPDLERGRWVVDVDDFMTTVGMLVEVPTVATVTAFTKEPVNAAAKSRPWTRLVFNPDSAVTPVASNLYAVDVTARLGWTTVPTAVEQATRLQASRFFSRRQSPYGVAGSPEAGSELRLLSRVDPDVGVSLRDYLRPRAVG